MYNAIMCGRFTLRTPPHVLVRQFQLGDDPGWKPRYNIAPTQLVLGVRALTGNPGRTHVPLRWGLVPSWSKDSKIASRMINARGETVATKLSFRSSFKRRRCLVLADGYYEWKKEGSGKQPFYIRFQDERAFAFAGLWERWSDADGQRMETCTIITTDANPLTQPIHERMPVILRPDDYDLWLDPEFQNIGPLQQLLGPFESEEMTAEPVSTYVNKPTNDSPKCIQEQRGLF